jgi:hypothetical protein
MVLKTDLFVKLKFLNRIINKIFLINFYSLIFKGINIFYFTGNHGVIKSKDLNSCDISKGSYVTYFFSASYLTSKKPVCGKSFLKGKLSKP